MIFNNFDDSIHAEREQKERLVRAIDKKTKIIDMDVDKKEATFQGSEGIYYTTMFECTCTDYAFRRKPCKHMYRLAVECDVIDIDTPPWGEFIEYVKQRGKLIGKLKADFSKRLGHMEIDELQKVTEFLEKL